MLMAVDASSFVCVTFYSFALVIMSTFMAMFFLASRTFRILNENLDVVACGVDAEAE